MADSYLAKQKERLRLLVDALEEELRNVESEDERKEVIDEWFKELWAFSEDGYKQSFRNGVASGRKGGPTAQNTTKKTRRFADWESRKREEAPE